MDVCFNKGSYSAEFNIMFSNNSQKKSPLLFGSACKNCAVLENGADAWSTSQVTLPTQAPFQMYNY